MTRGAQKTGGRRKRAHRSLRRERSQTRPALKKLLIVVDARRTEPNYFRALKQSDSVRRRWHVTVKERPGRSPEDVVDHALRMTARVRGDPYERFDETWVVMDVEGRQNHDGVRRACVEARRGGIRVALSNPCFEVWYLAHLEATSRTFRDAAEVLRCLDGLWRRRFGEGYEKDGAHFHRLSGRTILAIENAGEIRRQHHSHKAHTVDCNSSTDVYELVARLVGYEG